MAGRKIFALFHVAVLSLSALGVGRAVAAQDQKNLQLEVIINSVPAKMIGSFVLFDGKRIGATCNELEDVGLAIGQRRFPEEIVMLDDIPGLKYAYDEPGQTIRITVDNAKRRGQTFDVSGGGPRLRAQTGWGALLNYDLLGTTDNVLTMRDLLRPGASLTVDGRAFSPYGTFEQSGIVNSDPNRESDALRLNSTFEYSDQDHLTTFRAGDVINGGLPWTRPLRLGGFQAQSDFALRPDLITMPMPTLGGIAAVPSTVDVYVNNIKAFSQDVAPGPFSINNIPLITGAGNAQLVVTDSSGNVTKTTAPFFASASLLSPGLMSWSVEGGLPRLYYGSASDDYVESPVGSATLRRGIFDWMTAESHVEGGAGVVNGGLGAVVKTGAFGVASAALAASDYSGSVGVTSLSVLSGAALRPIVQCQFATHLWKIQRSRLGDGAIATVAHWRFAGRDVCRRPAAQGPRYDFAQRPTAVRPQVEPRREFHSFASPRPALSRKLPPLHIPVRCPTTRRCSPRFFTTSEPTEIRAFSSGSTSRWALRRPFPRAIPTEAAAASRSSTPSSRWASIRAAMDGASRTSEGGAPSHAATVSYRSSYGTVRAGVSANGARAAERSNCEARLRRWAATSSCRIGSTTVLASFRPARLGWACFTRISRLA